MAAPDVFLSDTPAHDSELSSWIGQGKKYKDVPRIVSDALSQRLALQQDVLAAMPAKTLPISRLVALDFSLQIMTLELTIPSSCFSEKGPNTSLVSLLQRPIPSREFIIHLHDLSGQAMLDGKLSIRDWTQKNIYLPFSALNFWLYLHDAALAKLAWKRARHWLKNLKGGHFESLLDRVYAAMDKIAWHGPLCVLGSSISVTDLALFFSQEMLTSSHVDTMLACLDIRTKMQLSREESIIPPTTFGQSLTGIPSYSSLYPVGISDCLHLVNLQLDGLPKRVWTVAYSHPLHFGALLIDTCHSSQIKINWGDSLSWKQPAAMIKGIKIWAQHHFPQKKLVFEQNLKCATQTDKYSCAIIAVNTLKHHLFGERLWSEKDCEVMRINECIEIMEYLLKHHHQGNFNSDPSPQLEAPDSFEVEVSGPNTSQCQPEQTVLFSAQQLREFARWEQVAAGSTNSVNGATGNTANAQMAARAGSSVIIQRRQKAFSNIRLGDDLASAKVDQLSELTNGCFGIVLVNGNLMIGKVLTMYERGGGKTAKHAWVSKASSIGSISYIPVQVWKQNRQRNFRAHWGSTNHLKLPRFAHLPAAAFLYNIPLKCISFKNDGAFLEISQKFFDEVYLKLAAQKILIDAAVRSLLKTRGKTGLEGGDDGLD